MTNSEYWQEAIAEILGYACIAATDDQVKQIASDIEDLKAPKEYAIDPPPSHHEKQEQGNG